MEDPRSKIEDQRAGCEAAAIEDSRSKIEDQREGVLLILLLRSFFLNRREPRPPAGHSAERDGW